MGKSWSDIEDPVVLFDRNLYEHPFAGLLWVLKKFCWNLDGEKEPNWECKFVHRKQVLFLSKNVDDIEMAGEKQNMAPMWKKLMKNVDLDEPTSFLDHVYLGCTQRECKPTEIITEGYKEMFESRGGQLTITRVVMTSRKDGCVVLRHGRTCSRMR